MEGGGGRATRHVGTGRTRSGQNALRVSRCGAAVARWRAFPDLPPPTQPWGKTGGGVGRGGGGVQMAPYLHHTESTPGMPSDRGVLCLLGAGGKGPAFYQRQFRSDKTQLVLAAPCPKVRASSAGPCTQRVQAAHGNAESCSFCLREKRPMCDHEPPEGDHATRFRCGPDLGVFC